MKTDKFTTRSSLGSTVVFSWKITEPENNLLEMRKLKDEFDELRPYYFEDYYPLTSTQRILGDSVWMAYQLNRKSACDGIVVAFRRAMAPDSACTVCLKGLDAKCAYTLTDRDSHRSFIRTGAELARGLQLVLPEKRSSLVLMYAATTPPDTPRSVPKQRKGSK